jgi:hypothetical protein
VKQRTTERLQELAKQANQDNGNEPEALLIQTEQQMKVKQQLKTTNQ